MSNHKDHNMSEEWDKILDSEESHDFLTKKSAEMLKKFQSGELLPMDFNEEDDD